ncbi:hypothetical protein [Solimicrobium silvestre]|uniref:Uncharacterized protein n=1 Tax=Solimicrobium silvestre TaxID=2099400 RepID=A0A2S9GY78_9BURK|nr:hypothetical protein [Solimicrobium silvestre]PRC92674.1 hypothetical protein S2091_2729 [Solimicrobium silvestre]
MAGEFKLDVSAMVAKCEGRINEVVQKIVIGISAELMEKSPVGDPVLWKSPPPKGYIGGHFRANWQYAFNVPPGGIIDEIDPSGDATKDEVATRVSSTLGDGTHYLVNNLPYAQRLENGWSTQAPIGMVALTVVDFSLIVNEAANGVQNGTSSEDFAAGFETYKL